MTERTWFVVRTNIKCEVRAEKSLRALGHRVYLPRMKKTIVHHRSKKLVNKTFMLFNRYLFVGVAEGVDWYSLRQCDGVEAVLGVNGVYFPVERSSVAEFMMAQRKGVFNKLIKKQAKAKKGTVEAMHPIGSTFNVKGRHFGGHHPFSGFHGQVISITGRGMVKAMVEIFGRLSPVEFSPEDISRTDIDQTSEAA